MFTEILMTETYHSRVNTTQL